MRGMAESAVAVKPAPGPWDQFGAWQRWGFLAVLFLVGTSSAMDRAIISIVLEQLKHEFHLSDAMLGLVGGAPFGVCYALSSVPLARLADQHGRKRVLFASTLGWTIMTAVCGLATTLPFLIIARMGVGAAEGGAVAPSHALIGDYFPPERRATALAIFTAAGTLGTLTAAGLGGYLTETHGWRVAFFGMAAISAPVVLLVLGVLKEPRRLAAAGSQEAASDLRSDFKALFGKRSYNAILVSLFFYAALPFGVIVFTPTFMVRSLGLGFAQAGALFGVAIAIGVVVGSLAGGYMADRLRTHGERWLQLMPAIVLAIDLPVAVIAYNQSSVPFFLAFHALNTALLYAVLPAIFASLQHVCGSRRRATATATAMLMLNAVGVTLAPIATGALSDLYAGWAGEESLRYALATMCCALLPAVFALLYGSRRVAAERED